jgi:hypothetical protein
MMPCSDPSGPHQDQPEYVDADIETDVVNVADMGFGDLPWLDDPLLANAWRFVLHDVESPGWAVARYDPGRGADVGDEDR